MTYFIVYLGHGCLVIAGVKRDGVLVEGDRRVGGDGRRWGEGGRGEEGRKMYKCMGCRTCLPGYAFLPFTHYKLSFHTSTNS